MERKEGPYTVDRGSIEKDGFLLTNVEWHPNHMIDVGQPETGIRRKQPDGTYAEFELIQHDWWDFEKANCVILRCLNKGWSVWRTDKLMDFMKNKGWHKAIQHERSHGR